MKILGLSCGRPFGNSEVLLREALTSAQEVNGAEFEIIRLHDLFIKPCTGCESCTVRNIKEFEGSTAEGRDILAGGRPQCVITIKKEDHIPFFIEKLKEADAFIMAAPTYHNTPPGFLITLRDRVNRHLRDFKPGVGAIIGVGGSDFVKLMLPLMHNCFPQVFKVVDHMLVDYTPRPAQVLMDEKVISRAQTLGRNVGKSMKLPIDNVKWLGEKGGCPICHNNLLLAHDNYVECPVCLINGHLKIDKGKTRIIFEPEEVKKHIGSHWAMQRHREITTDGHKRYDAAKSQIQEKLEKYKAQKSVTKPPLLTVR